MSEAPDPTLTVIGNMRSFRRARRWSARELADRLNDAGCQTSRSAIACMETGRRKYVTVDFLFALAHVFEVEITDLVAGTCPACGGSPPPGFTCNNCGSAAR